MKNKIELMEHNVETYKELCSTFETASTALVVLASGVGKSYISGKYIQDHNLKALVISPSVEIKNNWELFIDCNAITYSEFYRFSEDELDNLVYLYDIFIFDEAHHVGAKIWGRNLHYIKNKNCVKILGLTADPNRYNDPDCNNISELFDNNIIIGVNMMEAIDKGILPPFEYVSVLYNASETLKKNKDRIKEENIDQFNELIGQIDMMSNKDYISEIVYKHLTMSNDHKILVFCDSIKAIDDATKLMYYIFNNPDIYKVHSKMKPDDCIIEMNKFLNSKYRISICITVNKFNEGLHFEGIDTIFMLRKTSSPQIFSQQISRILSASNFNQESIIFDLVCNIDRVFEKSISEKQIDKIEKGMGGGIGWIKNISDQIIIGDYTKGVFDKIRIIASLYKDNYWNQYEESILKKYYKEKGSKWIHENLLPNRTIGSIKLKARKLNLQYIPEYTIEEINIIKKYYKEKGPKWIHENLLPHRTIPSIRGIVYRKKLNIKYKEKKWSKENEDIIKEYYSEKGPKWIHENLLPDMDIYEITSKANNLGLKVISKKRDREEKEDIIREYYELKGAKWIHKNLLPNIDIRYIYRKASEMGIRRHKGSR